VLYVFYAVFYCLTLFIDYFCIIYILPLEISLDIKFAKTKYVTGKIAGKT